MAYVNYKNSPSEETPLTGGATGNLNVMQENGTSHGSDTKLGYAQSFLNEHIVNVSNEVDEDYRVNFLKSKNLLSTSLELGTFTNSGVKDTSTANYRTANMVKVKSNTTYTTSINGTAQAYALYFYTSSGVYISSGTTATFTTPANCEYLNFRCFNADFTSDFANLKVQLEEGDTATSYEPYITPSIYVDNEEIYNQNIMNYSTSEIRIGTWLGKPLYRKVVKYSSTISAGWSGVAFSTLGLSNIEYLRIPSALGKNGNQYEEMVSNQNRIQINIGNSTLSLYLTDGSFSEITFILEYTKNNWLRGHYDIRTNKR